MNAATRSKHARETVILGGARTPHRSYRSVPVSFNAVELGLHALRAAPQRA